MLDAYRLLTGLPAPVAPRPTPPGEPRIGTATAGHLSATVRWAPPAFDGGSAVTGYTVYAVRARDSALVRTVTVAAPATGTTVTGLADGTPYVFVVQASNALGSGNLSRWTGRITPARQRPGAPALGVISPGSGWAVVRWAPPSDGGARISAYTVRVYRGTTLVKTVRAAASPNRLLVGGLINGAGYTVSVTATNAVGTGPGSHAGSVVPRTRPGAPRVVGLSPGDGQATVRWTAPSNGGAAITCYTVRAYRGSSLVGTVTAAGSATSAVVPGLVNGTGYTVTVTAANPAGAGPVSARSGVLVPLGPPAAPAP
jgi:hypothetical protein